MKRNKILLLLGFLVPFGSARADDTGIEPILEHPFQESTSFGNRGVKSAASGKSLQLNFRAKANEAIKGWHLNARISPREKGFVNFDMFKDRRIQTVEMGFSLDGFSLCQFQVKFHETLQGKMAAFGQIPRVQVTRDFALSDWPSQEISDQTIAETLGIKGLDPQFKLEQRTPCLWIKDGELVPVWVSELVSDQRLYLVVSDNQNVFRFEAKFFEATGKSFVYPHNVLDGERQEYPLREMKDTGYLENPYFMACVPSGTGNYVCPTAGDSVSPPYPMAKEPSFTYDYTVASNENLFAQTSVFTNANRALEWLEEHGYSNFGTAPIKLAIHAVMQGDGNNALYEPHTGYSVIYVGDGDGELLQNLATDSDVVSHELGHHVVYHTVKQIAGESLVLHEALADYFTFARTGNACLGESICPDTGLGSRVCAIPKKCLRSGDNALALTSPNLSTEPHQRSQFLSGMLWDLYSKDGIPINDVTRLVLKTIDLLVENSGYQHWTIGMLLADNAFFEGANCEKIRARAVTRGLNAYVSTVTCADIQKQNVISSSSLASVADYLGPQTKAAVTTTTKKSGSTNCGVLGGGSVDGHNLSLLLLWFLPFISTLIRRFRR